MAISDRISAMYDHVEDIYDTMALDGDTTSNKNIVNINTEIKREYKDFLANGTDTLWNNWEKVSGSGETLSLTPTIKGRIQTDLKGNTQQNGTPTPDSPIPIQVVSGDNSIKVEGKNLLNTSYLVEANANKSYSGHGFWAFKLTEELGVFTLSRKDNTMYADANYMAIGYGDIDQAYSNKLWLMHPTSSNLNVKSRTITNTNEVWLFLGNSQTKIDTTLELAEYLQFEHGNQATSYQEYQAPQTYPISLGNIELCKIGDYQDKIYKDNGKWYLNKQIGKYTFTGNETFTKSAYTTTDIWTMYWQTTTLGINVSVNNGWCEFGIVRDNPHINNVNNGVVYNVNTATTFVRLQKSQITNWDESATDSEKINLAKNMITGKSFYYPLATPTYEEITDSTLLGQLNNLYNANSYEGTTNVSQVNDDMPFILDMTMLKEM